MAGRSTNGAGKPRSLQSQFRNFPQPLWQGQPLPQGTILLHAEQGLGDTIQFIRFAAAVKECVGTVLCECPPSLVGLLQTCAGLDRIIPAGEPLPAFDVQAPLLSLPGILKTTLETIPARVPYLQAAAELKESQARASPMPRASKLGWCGREIPEHGIWITSAPIGAVPFLGPF